jgi:hypothetical protein
VSMTKCDRCAAALTPTTWDDCEVCLQDLCERCMADGCCGHKPARSGSEAVLASKPVPRPEDPSHG